MTQTQQNRIVQDNTGLLTNKINISPAIVTLPHYASTFGLHTFLYPESEKCLFSHLH